MFLICNKSKNKKIAQIFCQRKNNGFGMALFFQSVFLLCFSVSAMRCGTYFFTEPRMSPVFYDMKRPSFSRSVDIKQRQEAEIC